MCYPTPGPRCSYHTHKEYVEALQKYNSAKDADEKIILGGRLKEKQEAFESTPRGQNGLRREADAAEGLQRANLLLRLKASENLRKKQLEDYANVIVRKDTSLKEAVSEKGLNLNRYYSACGIAMLNLGTQFPDVEFHIEGEYTLSSKLGKLLVLPEKYQAVWGVVAKKDDKFKHVSSMLSNVLNTSLNLAELSEKNQASTWVWFKEALKAKGYVGFVSVNRKTQDMIVSTFDKVESLYEVSLKVKKRLSGTSKYTGSIENVQVLLKGTPFENASIIQDPKIGKTILYGVPPQARSACFLSEDIFLGWHKGIKEANGYYEVRKRQPSNNYDIHICLKASKQVVLTAVDSEIYKKFNKAHS